VLVFADVVVDADPADEVLLVAHSADVLHHSEEVSVCSPANYRRKFPQLGLWAIPKLMRALQLDSIDLTSKKNSLSPTRDLLRRCV
jgi:hypothetical protein